MPVARFPPGAGSEDSIIGRMSVDVNTDMTFIRFPTGVRVIGSFCDHEARKCAVYDIRCKSSKVLRCAPTVWVQTDRYMYHIWMCSTFILRVTRLPKINVLGQVYMSTRLWKKFTVITNFKKNASIEWIKRGPMIILRALFFRRGYRKKRRTGRADWSRFLSLSDDLFKKIMYMI